MSISCLYLPTLRSQATIVSEKSTVFTFSYTKFRENPPAGSGEDFFEEFLPYMNVAAIMVI